MWVVPHILTGILPWLSKMPHFDALVVALGLSRLDAAVAVCDIAIVIYCVEQSIMEAVSKIFMHEYESTTVRWVSADRYT
jgi:hypothetical protein